MHTGQRVKNTGRAGECPEVTALEKSSGEMRRVVAPFTARAAGGSCAAIYGPASPACVGEYEAPQLRRVRQRVSSPFL